MSLCLASTLIAHASKRLPDKSHSDRNRVGRPAQGTGESGQGQQRVSCSLSFRYLKQILDLPPPAPPQKNLLEMYRLKDEMGSLR